MTDRQSAVRELLRRTPSVRLIVMMHLHGAQANWKLEAGRRKQIAVTVGGLDREPRLLEAYPVAG